MKDLKALIAICRTALAGGNKAVSTLRKRRLTKEEKELLVAASHELGTFHFCFVDPVARGCIRAGSKQFFDSNDHAYSTKYLEAFQSLCERGYVEYRSGKLFVLNSLGYERAARLTKS